MGETTKIEWTDHTFNPWRGCTKVAAGCANCYAAREAIRFPKNRGVWGDAGTRVLAASQMWKQPHEWNRQATAAGEPARVFCASLADVFEDWPGDILDHKGGRVWMGAKGNQIISRPADIDAPHTGYRLMGMPDVRRKLFFLIDSTPWLIWQLLTKRPENIREMWNRVDDGPAGTLHRNNVWLGTSIATQEDADRNIPLLEDCRRLARRRFLSIEPLIGPVDLKFWNPANPASEGQFMAAVEDVGVIGKNRPVDWVIIGGESGPRARPCHLAWIRDIVHQCAAVGVPVFVKQVGSNPIVETVPEIMRFKRTDGRPLHKKGGDPTEWPPELRIRQFPHAASATPY